MVNAILAANKAASIPEFLESHFDNLAPRADGADVKGGGASLNALRLVCHSGACRTCAPDARGPSAKRAKRTVPAITAGARVGLSLKRAQRGSLHECFVALPYRYALGVCCPKAGWHVSRLKTISTLLFSLFLSFLP